MRVLDENGQSHDIEVTAGANWARIADSILALTPDRIDALDVAGKLIRAVKPADVDAEEEVEADEGIPVLANDPESIRLTTFARLLSEAYRHSTEVAFEKLGELFRMVVEKSQVQDATIDKLNAALTRMAIDQATGGGVDGPLTLDSLLGAFMQSRAAAASTPTTPTPPAATNGAAKPGGAS